MNIAQLLMSGPVKSDVMQTGVANGNSLANFKNIYNQIVAIKDGSSNHSVPLTNEELSSLKQLLQAESLTELPDLPTVESSQVVQFMSLEDVVAATGLDVAQLQQIIDKLTNNNVAQPTTSSNSLLPKANNTYVVPLMNATQNSVNAFTPLQQVQIPKEQMNQHVPDLSNHLESQKAVEQLMEDQPKLVDVTQLMEKLSTQFPELQKAVEQLMEDQPKLLDATQLMEKLSTQSPELQKAVEQLMEDQPKLLDATQLTEKLRTQSPELQKAVEQLMEDQPKLLDATQLMEKLSTQSPELQKAVEQLVKGQPKLLDATQLMEKLSTQSPELQKAVEQLVKGQPKLLDVTQLMEKLSTQFPELQKAVEQLVKDQPKLVNVTQLMEKLSTQSPELQKAVEQLVEEQPKLINEHQLIMKLFIKKIGERFPQLQQEVNKFIEDIPKFTDINQLLQMIDDRFPQLELDIQKFVKSELSSLDANQLWKEMDKLFSQIQVKNPQPLDNQSVEVDAQQSVKQQNPTAIQLQREASSDSTDFLNIVKTEELLEVKEVINETEQQITNIEELFVWMGEKAPQLLSQLTASLKGEHAVTPKEAKQVLQFLKVAELLTHQTVSATNSDTTTAVKVTELFSKIVPELQTMSELATKPKLQVFQQVIHRVIPKLEESVATETVVPNTQSSKTETITITLPTAKPAQSEALLKEMQAILNKSQISNVAGLTKLAIKLYPENLGTIRIEIVQQNGVLTARLLASTQAGKELLDQNVNQLKQAFVQQNIQMERLDIAQSLQDPNRSGREQSFTNNSSNQQREQQQEDEQQNDEQEEVLSFKDLLATEEVD